MNWKSIGLSSRALRRPPPKICRRADDAMLVCLIILLHIFFMPQCNMKIDISRQQFVPISGLQSFTLKKLFLSPNRSKSENFRFIDFDF